jgi:hypothetical protein
MTSTSTRPAHRSGSKALNIALWSVQGLLALTFVGTGIWKLTTPIPELAAKMPWMGEVSPSFLHLTAALDMLGGLGVVLPSLTRINRGDRVSRAARRSGQYAVQLLAGRARGVRRLGSVPPCAH